MEIERYEEMIRDAVSELSQTDTEVDEVPAEKITLSFNAQKDKIAAAHFDTLTHKISVLQDIPDSSSHDLAITTMHQLQPDEIHCSLAAPETLVEAIESFISTVKRDAKLLLSPWKDFAYETSKSRILQLNIRTADQPDSVSQQYSQVDMSTMDLRAKEIYMSGLMNLDCRLAVGAVGCLILALQRQLAQDAPEAIGAASCRVEDLSVVELGTWQVSNVLQIDQDALLALGVFATEQHASLHSSKSKEGLSLFNLLSETKTNPGTQLLLRRLRQPSCDNKVINDRLDAIAILVHPHNVNAVAAMRKSLSKVGKGVNVLHVLKSLKIGKTSHRFFRCLVQLTVLAQEQYEGIASLAVLDSKQLIVDILTTFDMSICNFTRDAIMSAIDFTESKAMRRMVIAAGFDEKLDDLRHEYEGLDDLLARVARQIQAETPSDVASEINVVYFPQIGYLIAIHVINNGYENVEEKDMIGSQLGWEYQFMTRDVVYFKSDQMCELDAHLGDLATMIADRETELVYDLSQLVIGYTKEFTAMAGAIAELDVLLALARVSELNRFNKPVIASTPIIRISQGRHPLQELCVDNFVQNDTFFSKSTAARIRVDDEIEIVESRHATPAATTTHCKSGTPALRTDNVSVASLHSQPSIESNTSAMVITGANGSGKSVYLKQVGLIVLMAHIGCYVPAESATIGLVDKIFTRIMCKESSSRMQSAFMIDLAQVSHAMRNASGRSLVLLDEFGKGTLPTDGAGVFAASLNYLVRRGDDCPFIIATTHFHDLWAGGYINVDASLTIAHMRVKSSCDSEGQITLTHLHKLELELSKDSGAFNCALANNISADIVERAKNISQLYTFNTLDDIALEWLDAGPSEELIEGQAIMKRFLEWDVQQAYFDNSDVHSIVRFVDDHIIHDIVPLHEQ